MSDPLKLAVLLDGIPKCELDLLQPLELGRREGKEHTPLFTIGAAFNSDGHARLPLVPYEDRNNLSRHFLLLTPQADGRVGVTNRSERLVRVRDRALISGATESFDTPLEFHVLETLVLQVYKPGEEDQLINGGGTLHSLERPTMGPATPLDPGPRTLFPTINKEDRQQVIAWLQSTLAPLYRAITSSSFLDEAARLLVDVAGFDAGMVLFEGKSGREVLSKFAAPATGPLPEQEPEDPARVLRAVKQSPNPKTYWAAPEQLTTTPAWKVLVASPLLSDQREVIGYLCGLARGPRPAGQSDHLAATLMDLIATGVATGLARQDQERMLGQYRTFFPQLSDRVLRDPSLLTVKDLGRVTVLFCDVRRFSSIAEGQTPRSVYRFIGRLLEAISKCVQAEKGVIVDYVGDALMAMWGAPEEQEDQELRAVRTALAMLDVWDKQVYPASVQDLGGPKWANTNLGIGINTGPAVVGNIGSSVRFKYGPLGNAVNVASRVQGLTKYVGCRLLVTRDTHQELRPSGAGGEYLSRRIGEVGMVNIGMPCELFEVVGKGGASVDLFRGSEEALNKLERMEFLPAIHQASALLEKNKNDGPLLFIIQRAVEGLKDPEKFDRVWTSSGK